MCKYFINRWAHLSFPIEHFLEQINALCADILLVVYLVELLARSQLTAPALSDLGLDFFNSDASIGQDTVYKRVKKNASRPDIRLLAVPLNLIKGLLPVFLLLNPVYFPLIVTSFDHLWGHVCRCAAAVFDLRIL